MYGVELMTSLLENYRERVLLGARDRREKLTIQSERTFERQLKNAELLLCVFSLFLPEKIVIHPKDGVSVF